jgi:hypothetical protein
LLVACLSDELSSELPDVTRHQIQKIVQSHPKKGNAGIRKALQRDLPRLKKSGQVFAVVDSDRVRDLWKHSGISAPNCISGTVARFKIDVPGQYDLVLMIENTETLIAAVCSRLGVSTPAVKSPDERDRLLGRAAWQVPADERRAIRAECPCFDRIVERVSVAVAAAMLCS